MPPPGIERIVHVEVLRFVNILPAFSLVPKVFFDDFSRIVFGMAEMNDEPPVGAFENGVSRFTRVRQEIHGAFFAFEFHDFVGNARMPALCAKEKVVHFSGNGMGTIEIGHLEDAE